MKNARTLLMGVLLITYCIGFVYYLSNFEHPLIPFRIIKGSVYIGFALMTLATWIDERMGYVSFLHQYVNWLIKFTLTISFLLIGLYHFNIVGESFSEIYLFIISIFVYTIMLLYKCYKKGLFSKAQV